MHRSGKNESETRTPSTTRISPLTYWLASLARNTIGPAKSCGWPQRPAGMRSEIWRRRVGSARSLVFLVRRWLSWAMLCLHATHMSVSMYPGHTALTCTFAFAHSLLRAFVSWPRAPFAAAYAGTVTPPWKVRREQKLIILPRLRGSMCRPAA